MEPADFKVEKEVPRFVPVFNRRFVQWVVAFNDDALPHRLSQYASSSPTATPLVAAAPFFLVILVIEPVDKRPNHPEDEYDSDGRAERNPARNQQAGLQPAYRLLCFFLG